MQPIAPDIPVTGAWQSGRRIYVAPVYQSQLGRALWFDARAHYDKRLRAYWVGATKKPLVLALVREHRDQLRPPRRDDQQDPDRRWVIIPLAQREAPHLYRLARSLGGVRSPRGTRWTLPSREAAETLRAAVSEHLADRVARVEQSCEPSPLARVTRGDTIGDDRR